MKKPEKPPALFDHALLQERRGRSMASPKFTKFLQQQTALDLADRLTMVKRDFAHGLDLFCASSAMSEALTGLSKINKMSGYELTGQQLDKPAYENIITGPAETLPFDPASYDLIFSNLTLQYANDLPGLLIQIKRSLKPGGLFLGAITGAQTLTELRQSFAAAENAVEGGISPRVIPLADIKQMGALLQRAGFILPVTDCDLMTARYATPLALIHDLRFMGATNVMNSRRKTPLRRKTLHYAIDYYKDNFTDPDGRIRATFEIIYLSGWQQEAKA